MGRSFAHPLVVLSIQFNKTTRVRIGVSAGRSIGGSVQRNRAKRRLREAIRPVLPDILPGWDLILIARATLNIATLQEIRQAIIELLDRARLLSTTHES